MQMPLFKSTTVITTGARHTPGPVSLASPASSVFALNRGICIKECKASPISLPRVDEMAPGSGFRVQPEPAGGVCLRLEESRGGAEYAEKEIPRKPLCVSVPPREFK